MKTDLQKQLDQDIPKDAIEQRQGGGKMLSYLTGAYVINRLNQVLGQGNWGYRVETLNKVFEGQLEGRSGAVHSVSYTAIVEFYFRTSEAVGMGILNNPIQSFTEVGYGDGTDKTNPGKAHELATKEAITDGLKRAAKNLGISMGLGLYFKDGNYEVADSTTPEAPKQTETNKKAEAVGESNATASKAALPTKLKRQKIKDMFQVLKELKRVDTDSFKKDYLYGSKVDDLADDKIEIVLTKMMINFPELGA